VSASAALQGAVLFLGWLLPVATLLAFNLHYFGSPTGYDSTHESLGFRWGYFVAIWDVMLREMNDKALCLVFPLGVAGIVVMTAFRRGWQLATAALGVAYLSVWLVFGLLCYAVYRALNMPWPDQRLIGGGALVLAALYALTPLKRASEARCRELCALHGPLPFNLLRSALVAGARYGLRCLGCTAGLMVAAVLIGMTSLGWMVIISGLVLVYKLAPPLAGRYKWLASLAVAALGIAYLMLA
jgi:predicted metal-binding membrane protein